MPDARSVASDPAHNALHRQANPAAEDPRPERSVRPTQDVARLNESEVRQLQDLKARDREVRAHEHAHVAAGGALVRGGARFSYQQGPDGRNYAVGGEVSIAAAEVSGDPQKTAENAEQVQRAALAPANPSAQDRAVAANAAATASKARSAAAQEQRREAAEAQPDAETQDNSAAAPVAVRDETEPAQAAAQSKIALYESVATIGEDARAERNQREQALLAIAV